MNPWSLDKDKTIKRLLLALEARFGSEVLGMSRRWDGDRKAVGLFLPGEEALLAYVNTHGEAHGKYTLHLEYPGFPAGTETSGENLDLHRLLDLLAIHFDLPDRRAN